LITTGCQLGINKLQRLNDIPSCQPFINRILVRCQDILMKVLPMVVIGQSSKLLRYRRLNLTNWLGTSREYDLQAALTEMLFNRLSSDRHLIMMGSTESRNKSAGTAGETCGELKRQASRQVELIYGASILTRMRVQCLCLL